MPTMTPTLQFNQPSAHARIAMGGGFAFPASVTSKIGVTNVVRNAAGDYTITTSRPFKVGTGVIFLLNFLGVTAVGGHALGISQLTGTTFRVTAATGGALADVGTVEVVIVEMVGDI